MRGLLTSVGKQDPPYRPTASILTSMRRDAAVPARAGESRSLLPRSRQAGSPGQRPSPPTREDLCLVLMGVDDTTKAEGVPAIVLGSAHTAEVGVPVALGDPPYAGVD